MEISFKEARKRAGLSRPQVHKLLGIPVRTQESWEAGDAGKRTAPEWVERLVVKELLNMKGERKMTYAELKKTGEKIYEFDRYGNGPYQSAYAGTTEWWVANGEVWIHRTSANTFSYDEKQSNTQYLGSVKDIERLKLDLNAETYDYQGIEIPVDSNHYDWICNDVKNGEY